jgi:hypothetical protein
MARHLVQLPGNVLASFTQCAAALPTARIIWLVNNVYA